jgi:hypothetical protein
VDTMVAGTLGVYKQVLGTATVAGAAASAGGPEDSLADTVARLMRR